LKHWQVNLIADFAHFYIGGLLYGTPAIHSAEANQQKQIELAGVSMANSYFIRPAFYGFLLKPLRWLPYLRSFAPGRHDLLILAAMTPPLIVNFVPGQDRLLALLRNPIDSPIPAIMPNLRGFVYAIAGDWDR
jgi:hypothetical protein